MSIDAGASKCQISVSIDAGARHFKSRCPCNVMQRQPHSGLSVETRGAAGFEGKRGLQASSRRDAKRRPFGVVSGERPEKAPFRPAGLRGGRRRVTAPRAVLKPLRRDGRDTLTPLAWWCVGRGASTGQRIGRQATPHEAHLSQLRPSQLRPSVANTNVLAAPTRPTH